MTAPVVSICVPTYNRARFLRCLLESFVRDIGALTHPYEILIADNASTDDTEKLVAEFTGKLPIRYFKREVNLGPYDNRDFLKQQVLGEIYFYISDDDLLLFPEVDALVTKMLAHPEIGVMFAPWQLFDRVGNQVQGNFYEVENTTIAKGDYEALFALLLKNHIFPEVYMIRTKIMRAVDAFTHPLAYWAFVQAAEYLALTQVGFHTKPFYATVTRYFEDGAHDQYGHSDVKTAWDSYRGGLEYILARVPPLPPEKAQHYLLQIQLFISIRIRVALKMRLHANDDPIETYYLASRLRAMGFPQLLPVPFDEIRIPAILFHIITGGVPSYNIQNIVAVGAVPEWMIEGLNTFCPTPVKVLTEIPDLAQHAHSVLLIPGTARDTKLDHAALARHHIRLLGAEDMLLKFS